jgi:hypothetical protein
VTPSAGSKQVESRDELVASGERLQWLPRGGWAPSTKFGYTLDDLRPLPYAGERGIRAILTALADRFDWQPVLEDDLPIALLDETGASITLEPGGQLELSGALLDNIHQTCNFAKQVRSVTPLNIAFLGMGFPGGAKRPVDAQGRFTMRNYMQKVGAGPGRPTCRAGQPTRGRHGAQFAPRWRCADRDGWQLAFSEAQRYLSYRSRLEDTDPDTGMLPFVFDEGMGFQRYVDWVLDVPMYFVYRDGRYINALGQSFRDFLLPAAGPAGREADAQGLGGPPDHRLSGSAAETLPGNARRGRRPVGLAVRPARLLGGPAVPSTLAGRRLGHREGLDAGRTHPPAGGGAPPGTAGEGARPDGA